jgi:hypothetical protein
MDANTYVQRSLPRIGRRSGVSEHPSAPPRQAGSRVLHAHPCRPASPRYAAFVASFDHSQTRKQGSRLAASGSDVASPPASIIQHADVRPMRLAQKTFPEGGLSLAPDYASVVDQAPVDAGVVTHEAKMRLDLLTRVGKSWANNWCVEANRSSPIVSARASTRAKSAPCSELRLSFMSRAMHVVTQANPSPAPWADPEH